ncbi:FxsA family protein [Mycobacterium vicinigordonae]|uniref:FxsA family protein n=1 Tax=Mycobacterium vicinigordonae TaxID=1719132 RepID=A0A7D6HLP4_9MYCO|nr:FxsA family protein [Mycobacterium vicinigordonae]QLL05431.1 FxsA family protein [Mycobacterium vicinigordonae]
MLGRLFLIYAVVELMVTIGLAAAIGVGWTVLVLLVTFLGGVIVGAPMGGLQISRQFRQLRSGTQEPRNALTDGALTTLATGLVMVPGLASTVLGLLLLMPPVRAVARPGLAAVAWRVFERRVPLITDITDGHGRRDYIDGEVIDVHEGWDVDPPPLPSTPFVYQPSHRAP